MKQKHLFFLLIALCLADNSIQANERKFAFTHETSTLQPGLREIEVWNTYSRDKNFFYRQLDQQIEFEFGVSNNLMSAFYLNYRNILQDNNGNAAGGVAERTSIVSFSNEWKYKLMDRVADPFGFALYGEATLGLDEFELEGKLLFDKQIDNSLFAFNIIGENEWETELLLGTPNAKSEFKNEIDFAYAYSLNNNFSAGIEIQNSNIIEDGSLKHSVLFAGPVFSYTAEQWWVTGTIFPQITSFVEKTQGHLDLDDYEKLQARLLFSFKL